MKNALGFQTGFELFAKKKWLAVSMECILWNSIPSALTLNFLQWGTRGFPDRPVSTSLTIIRIAILWFDWEIYFVGGVNE